MSEKLPVLSGKDVIKALLKAGFKPVRQRGSHVFLKHEDGRRTVVPLHGEVNRSTLMDIFDQTRLTKEEFLSLIKKKR
ncbi:MAG: type II toxin-antitoxin system HicA family toxin [Thaumarchaeota archaeon]|nr:type II toxin-antitoxin system HicA family toxin [Nitrososphaerota archaeon]